MRKPKLQTCAHCKDPAVCRPDVQKMPICAECAATYVELGYKPGESRLIPFAEVMRISQHDAFLHPERIAK